VLSVVNCVDVVEGMVVIGVGVVTVVRVVSVVGTVVVVVEVERVAVDVESGGNKKSVPTHPL
jgi:hypothetical protein